MVITVLADEIEYLRYIVSQQPNMSPALRGLTTGTATDASVQFPSEAGERAYLTEEEEEAIALKLNGLISDQDLERIREEVAASAAVDLPPLSADIS